MVEPQRGREPRKRAAGARESRRGKVEALRYFFGATDWRLLREQKASLVALSQEHDGGPRGEHLVGLVHLIDELQDTAVAGKYQSEEAVFGLEEA